MTFAPVSGIISRFSYSVGLIALFTVATGYAAHPKHETPDLTTHKQLARQFIRAFGNGDTEKLRAMLTDARFEFEISASSTVLGLDEFITMASQVKTNIRDGRTEFKILSLTAEEDRVAIQADGYSVTVKGDQYNNRYMFLVTIERQKITRITVYNNSKLVHDLFGNNWRVNVRTD